MPLDILVPFWGDPGFFKQTVRSVLTQDNGDWLLTVVDDAYPDRSIGDYLAGLNDPRITYLRKEHNEGITANFRTCVSLATQEMLVILGCDDILLPNYVDTVLNARKAFPEADIIQPGVQIIDDDGRTVTTLTDSVKQRVIKPRGTAPRVLKGESLARSLMHGDWLYWPSLAFRTDKIREVDFDDRFAVIQDLALVLDMITLGATVLVEPTVCFSYRRHMASASAEKLVDGSRFDGEREFYGRASRQLRTADWKRAARAAQLRLTSRAHALTLVPRVALSRDGRTLRKLLRHAFGV